MSILDLDLPNLIGLQLLSHKILGRCVSVLELTTFSRHPFD